MTSSGIRQRQRSNLNMLPPPRGDRLAATLDSHDTPSITNFTVGIPDSVSRPGHELHTNPSRWRTKEFIFYAMMFVLVVPVMIWIPIRLSSPTNPNYPLYARRLSKGWLFGRPVDMSDRQYSSFRNNLFPLLLLSSVHCGCSFIQKQLAASPQARARFIAIFSICMLVVLHGVSALKILTILSLNFAAAKSPKSAIVTKTWPAVLFMVNMGVLFLNERFDGYKLGELHAMFDPLDTLGGILPRWHISFNITMLRIISFAMDYHWRNTVTPVKTPLPHDQYTFINFLAYSLYPPLYIAGPIMTFNDFMHQLHKTVAISTREKVLYSIRFIFCLLTMESILHTMYVVAIKDSKAWEGDSPAELSMIGVWNLLIVWLKLLIPWRFFRLWALLDGVDPPENMVRCMANNYSTLGFWKSWHRSYNLWVVRYLYIPLGGAKRRWLSTLVVFTFVALWHDLSMKLLAWGWLVSLFILPEILASFLLPASKFGDAWWYRHLCASGGVVNMLLMTSANLVGFVLGLDGMRYFLYQLTSSWAGLTFMLFACLCLFVAVQVMFEYREEEHRQGLDRKC
ncbi:hypothetical protein TREMEDRAFT_72521 [Tremella mesenterica DSM 1558]|uniref:uncharacterized protein n=1 Tax=Tremella mesenterica (strain ATCC 24925 / CBS 8224 / DSM 1558 / NBRC 9311 / NRRL Y-6157 / RJB 2259-6 / UBC 559-6) TaxID=578456 RepID=UPI00032C8242|nr:uncharacterized protein TREMEDRAFT_72521 [Tremella mesenterica DSM 1558]EIW65751.1 hypothetical protein TREMEDRAFT_72521 [Tremella mesenterica DSM 1558]